MLVWEYIMPAFMTSLTGNPMCMHACLSCVGYKGCRALHITVAIWGPADAYLSIYSCAEGARARQSRLDADRQALNEGASNESAMHEPVQQANDQRGNHPGGSSASAQTGRPLCCSMEQWLGSICHHCCHVYQFLTVAYLTVPA